MKSEQAPVGRKRVLHVLDGLERGGITTWLMNVLRHIESDSLQMDFLVHTTEPCSYDEEARSLGAQILHCPAHRKPWIYVPQFTRLLKQHGPYHIVHSHCHRFSGLVLLLAYRAGVPVRIAHSHGTASTATAAEGLLRRAYYSLMDRWIDKYCTAGFAASTTAARDLFGENWQSDPRWRILFCGIDTGPFRRAYERASVRAELDLPTDALVVGHVGRFTRPKNHAFMLDILSHAIKIEPKLRLVFVGDGPEQEAVGRMTKKNGLTGSVLFLGSRPDVPRLLLACMDLFLFPSIAEGLGLALVEAQAAGLPCLVSDAMPTEAELVPPLVRRLPLSQGSSSWAKELLSVIAAPREIPPREALAIVEKSPFNLSHSIRELQDAYLGLSRSRVATRDQA